jgi:predicted ATPase with chaperone activity
VGLRAPERRRRVKKEEPGIMSTISKKSTLEDLFREVALPNEDAPQQAGGAAAEHFRPQAPTTFQEAGISQSLADSLVCKYLLANGSETGRQLSESRALPLKDLKSLLNDLKNRQLVFYKDSGHLDFTYALSDMGRERAKKYLEECTYVGAAPVPLEDYIESIGKQTIALEKPGRQDLARAFEGLLMNDELLGRLGPAVNSGRGLFLYGAPGNGKSSIAERITSCFGSEIWIPRSLLVEGQIIMLYDPQVHHRVAVNSPLSQESMHDERWVKIKRPTIVVGGELVMDALEIAYDPVSKISHAPVQLKSNCGSLVIDDFGRQRINPFELLNRWIVPLEKRYDFLQLVNGMKIEVPFDQLIIFSTNLEPRDLVDDAFLRRIPYKIEVKDPSESEIRDLLEITAERARITVEPGAIDHLVERYRTENRPFRFCHARDLVDQILNHCRYCGVMPVMNTESVNFAMTNYFTVV